MLFEPTPVLLRRPQSHRPRRSRATGSLRVTSRDNFEAPQIFIDTVRSFSRRLQGSFDRVVRCLREARVATLAAYHRRVSLEELHLRTKIGLRKAPPFSDCARLIFHSGNSSSLSLFCPLRFEPAGASYFGRERQLQRVQYSIVYTNNPKILLLSPILSTAQIGDLTSVATFQQFSVCRS